MSIKNVKIKNFTVFESIDIDFASGINVIIGENGTGKTHLMKMLYANFNGRWFSPQAYFGVDDDKRLRRNVSEKYKLEYGFYDTDKRYENGINNYFSDLDIKLKKGVSYGNEELTKLNVPQKPKAIESLVFIPAKDILTHSKGFLSLYDKFDMPFDKTYYDIISKSLLPNLKKIPEIGKSILPKLEKLIDGKVVVENDTFFIEKTNGKKIEFSVEAEGIKKIAILWQLIMSESITKGSVLFWDEPESNINPSLYKDVTGILLELSRNGVQIFLATHNYSFAKYIEVLSEDSDNVRYHSLYKTDDGVKCETETKFTLLSNNALREDNINLYNVEMKKEFEE
ncbi:MAG: AAA family ATPase [Paludibacter sp.]|nr:AAA family ATPase [Paludibacter sp.]